MSVKGGGAACVSEWSIDDVQNAVKAAKSIRLVTAGRSAAAGRVTLTAGIEARCESQVDCQRLSCASVFPSGAKSRHDSWAAAALAGGTTWVQAFTKAVLWQSSRMMPARVATNRRKDLDRSMGPDASRGATGKQTPRIARLM